MNDFVAKNARGEIIIVAGDGAKATLLAFRYLSTY